MINYKSTRGSQNVKTAAQAVIQGIAEDKGLYVPDAIPCLPFSLDDMVGKTYKDISFEIIKAFFTDYTDEELNYCIQGAYTDKFEADDVVPVEKGNDAYFLELYHGRTAAFKDMALSILPYLLTTAMKKEKEEAKICILTATSGDTGKAALEGFADVPGTEIIVFFPNKGVSEVQERQMTSQVGDNTHVFAINGNFDDAQSGVKKIFADDDFAENLKKINCKLSSANSINIGRLVPQVAYYVYGYLKLVEKGAIKVGEKINVVVPTGNFGNILAAYYAKHMGTPIDKLICASNENKVLTDFINTGCYDIRREFYLTNSPSMDILISSNLERLLYHLSGNDGEIVADLMKKLDTEKYYDVSASIKGKMDDFVAGYCTVEETNNAIGKMYREYNYLMDTHTAVAYKVYEDYKKETGDDKVALIASTASAYKFADSVAKAINLPEATNGFEYIKSVNENTGVRVPSCLKGLENRKVIHDKVIDIQDMPQVVFDSVK